MKRLPVLIIEDSENDTLLLLRVLRKGGYEPVYRRVQTKEAMGEALRTESWELVISDHDMPNFSAPAALQVLKESGQDLPFIIISGAIGEEVAVAAMKAGAHDYIVKGNLARLIPAVQRELREAENRRKRRKIEAEAQKRYQENQMLSARILNAYEEERARLARELHDEIGQALTVISLDLQYLQVKLSAAEHECKEKLAASINLLSQTLDNVRRQIVSLRPPALDKMGLLEVLHDMAGELSSRAGLTIKIKENGFSQRLPAELETSLYRCIQEALTNIVRHACASTVNIQLDRNGKEVTVVIQDDGKGFQREEVELNCRRFGLAGMRERVNLLQGKFQINTALGEGVKISINIPLPHDGKNGVQRGG